jgi:hypothetical protein
MFISKREAEERLAEDRNIFRSPADSASSAARKDDDIETPDEVDECGTVQEQHQEQHQDLGLAQLDNLLHPRIHGRANYRNRLESQVAIAQTELIIGDTKTSQTFGLSLPQTYAYTRGLRSTADITNHTPPKPELTSRINKIKEELAEKAAARLDETLNALSASKIAEIKRATNLSKVAKDMAVILDKCTDTKEEGGKGVHFHIFVPDPVDVDRYPIVNVGPKLEGSVSSSSSGTIDQ